MRTLVCVMAHPDDDAYRIAGSLFTPTIRSYKRAAGARRGAESVFRRWNEQRKAMGLPTFDPTLTYHMRGVPDLLRGPVRRVA
jgi:hypothetical protein